MSAASQKPSRRVHTYCGMCNTRCGVEAVLRDGVLVDVEPAPGDPLNAGRICPRAAAAVDVVHHPDRLRTPLKKTPDGTFSAIPWEQAMEEIAARMLTIRDTHGNRALGVWKGEAVGFGQQEGYARRFAHAFGTPNYFSNDSACFNARYLGYSLVTGFYQPFPDFTEADLILLFGTNPPMGHPPFMREFADARENGAHLVVIDPRLNPVACYADIFAQPSPGTDGALAWGLIRYLIESKNYDTELVENFSVGFERLARYAARFTPEFVEEQSGIYASVVEDIGRLIVRHRPRISIFAGTGLEHNENGVNNIRTVAALGCLCGLLDTRHGQFWPEPMGVRSLTLYDEIPLEGEGPIGADRFPVLYEKCRECHTMTAMEYMLGRGDYPLRGLILTAGNPAVTNPNTRKVEAALGSLDLLVVNDLFMTATARLAHYVLPAACYLERSELIFRPKEQQVLLSERVLGPDGVHDEYTFWHDLANALGFAEQYFPWKNEEEVNRWLLEPTGVTLETLRRHPHGVVYKPPIYGKHRSRPLPTPSGKVEFVSAYLKQQGFPELPEYMPPYHIREKNEAYPYVLTTGARKSLFYHSRHQNVARFRTIHASAEAEIHPQDAAHLGIRDGEVVRLVSEIGALEIPVRVVNEPELLQGVVEVYHGWEKWPVNELTFDAINDPISGFPLLKGVPIRIEKLSETD